MGGVSPLSPISNIEAMNGDMEPCSSDPRDTDDPSTSTYMSSNLDKGPCCFDMETNRGKRNNHSDDVHAIGLKRARQDNCSSCLTYRLKADEMTEQLHGREARVVSSEPVSTIIHNPLLARDASGMEVSGVNNIRIDIIGISPNKSNDVGFLLPELPTELSFLPQFMDRSHLTYESDLGESMLSPFRDHYFRKPVSMGPEHQVDVPPMDSIDIVNYDAKSSNKFVGTCIIPMPDTDTLSLSFVELGNDVSNCCCADNGSSRCVKHHVTEAREHAKRMFGPEKFTQLGFCDMGEDVAKGWSVEEEQLFSEVILANPASEGKSFWNVLPRVFTTWNKKELVSYYFNVFMLRKRADQNRSDPYNAGSDNDEWQDGYDGHHIMDGARECPDRSAIYKDIHVVDHEEDQDSSDEDDNDEGCDDYDAASESTEQGWRNLCNQCVDGYNEDDSDEETCVHFAPGSERSESGNLYVSPCSVNAYKSHFVPSELTFQRNTQHTDDNDAHDDPDTFFNGRHGEHKSVRADTKDLSVRKSIRNATLV